MNACRILETLQQHGISCRRDGDTVELRPASGMVPPDMIELARAHKPELLQALPDAAEIARQRSRLLTAARELGIPRLVIAELPDAEIDGCELLTDPGIRRYAQICLENWLTARGVAILHPIDPTKDLERFRATHPDSPPTRGTNS